ncbi:MAG: HIT domain-containing protein [bacterium]|nr:HIT domain-containing protein [bacterium]
MTDKEKKHSELRLDLVSKDWVVIATSRARGKRPFEERRIPLDDSLEKCPFETMAKQESPTLAYLHGEQVMLPQSGSSPKDWTTISIPNKYPAFFPQKALKTKLVGPYSVMQGVGYHEVIVTRHHRKEIPDLPLPLVKELFDLYQKRYLEVMNVELINHIAIFKNKGFYAGASLFHPHSQLIANPVLDPDLRRSLNGSASYYAEHATCAHCVMLEWDLKDKKRVVFENERMAVICPFAPRGIFEMRIIPKEHSAYFEWITEEEKVALAEAFQVALRKLKKAMRDPDYNYFLHTAPADRQKYDHYHWHWEILPKTMNWGGFEVGTGIQISTIAPEEAAGILRKS